MSPTSAEVHHLIPWATVGVLRVALQILGAQKIRGWLCSNLRSMEAIIPLELLGGKPPPPKKNMLDTSILSCRLPLNHEGLGPRW